LANNFLCPRVGDGVLNKGSKVPKSKVPKLAQGLYKGPRELNEGVKVNKSHMKLKADILVDKTLAIVLWGIAHFFHYKTTIISRTTSFTTNTNE
jgi:hypothetical protein